MGMPGFGGAFLRADTVFFAPGPALEEPDVTAIKNLTKLRLGLQGKTHLQVIPGSPALQPHQSLQHERKSKRLDEKHQDRRGNQPGVPAERIRNKGDLVRKDVMAQQTALGR